MTCRRDHISRPATASAPKTSARRRGHRVVGLIAALLAVSSPAALAGPSNTHPDLPAPGADLQPPAGAPAAPGDPFDPPAAAKRVDPRAPVISAWNRTALPGESFTIAGSRLTLGTGDARGADTGVWLGYRDGKAFRITQLATWIVADEVVTATVPKDIPYGVYLVWVENAAGPARPVALNKTSSQWIGPLGAAAAPGTEKRVFGRNLSYRRKEGSRSHVWLYRADTDTRVAARVTSAGPFAVSFAVPASLAAGTYTVLAHAGHGGRCGWGRPLQLRVRAPWKRGAAQTTLRPSGGDDAPALQKAIDAMSAHPAGGTVHLAAGDYLLADAITIKSGVALVGAGKKATVLNTKLAAAKRKVRGGIILRGDHLLLKAFTTVLHKSAGMPRYAQLMTAYPDRGADWTLDAVAIRHDRTAARAGLTRSELARGDGVEVKHCTFEVSLNLGGSKDVWAHHNEFHGSFHASERESLFASIKALERAVIEHNTARDRRYALDPADDDLTIKRFINFSNGGSGVYPTKLIYIAHNRGENIAPNPATDMNKGEIILFHSSSGLWRGQVASHDAATGTTTVRTDGTIDGAANACAAAHGLDTAGTYGQIDHHPSVIVVRGTGRGQVREMAARTDTTFTVDRPWRVPPDSSSVIVIAHGYTDCTVYDNHFTAFPAAAQEKITYSASGLVQNDEGYHTVVENNSVKRSYGGLRISARPDRVTYWNTYRNNRIENNQTASVRLESTGMDETAAKHLRWPILLGNRLIGTTVTTVGPNRRVASRPYTACYQIMSQVGGFRRNNQHLTPVDRSIGNICEANAVTGGERGIIAGGSHRDLFRNNTVVCTDLPTAGKELSPSQPVLVRAGSGSLFYGNTYTPVDPADPVYAKEPGATAGGRLSVPYRVVYIAAGAGNTTAVTIPIRNVGVDTLRWSVSADTEAPWLTLGNTNGSLSPESAGSFVVTVDAGAPGGGNRATVLSVSDGSTNEMLTVQLVVTGGGRRSSPPSTKR